MVELLLKLPDPALDSDPRDLPSSSALHAFLSALASQLSPHPSPGEVIRVPLPKVIGIASTSPNFSSYQRSGSLSVDPW